MAEFLVPLSANLRTKLLGHEAWILTRKVHIDHPSLRCSWKEGPHLGQDGQALILITQTSGLKEEGRVSFSLKQTTLHLSLLHLLLSDP